MADPENRAEQRELPLPVSSAADAIVINDRCVLRVEQDLRVVVVAGVVVAHFATDDRMERAYAMVSLVERGWADQNDVARVFEVSARTVRRFQRKYEDDGMAGLGRGPGYPSGRPRGVSGERTLLRLKDEGQSNRAVAHRLGISEKAVRKRLRRLGWEPPATEQKALPFASAVPPGADPNLSASSTAQAETAPEAAPTVPPGADPNLSASSIAQPEAVPKTAPTVPPGADPNLSASSSAPTTPAATRSADTDPMDRRFDRFLAHMGLLEDAAPLFASATRVPNAGVLLAVPSLVASGVFDASAAPWS